MWLYIIILSAVILFFIVRKKSKSRKVYSAIGFIISLIFIFRFACDNISCISNVFFGDINSKCEIICNQCNSFETNNISILQFKENENLCNFCNRCKADWNIRAAFDSSGIVFLGIILSMFFLYAKNYSIKEFLRGLDSINLFGVLSFKVSQIEKTVDDLSDEMQLELLEKDVQKKATKVNNSIHKNSRTPFDTLHLFIDKIETEYTKLDNIIKQKENIISLQKQKQFEKLTNTIQKLFDFVKKDWANKYINRIIIVAKKILILLYSLLDYLQSSPPATKAKYLIDSLGVDVVGDRYSKIINAGSKIPIEKSENYRTIKDNQTSIRSEIFFGSNPIASKNKSIGVIEISGLPKLPKGKAKITVLFKIDKFGLLIAKQICDETNNIVQKEFDVSEYLETEDE
ncbi:MAG: Hsp70 family protein [Saprospiraceae bacterium]